MGHEALRLERKIKAKTARVGVVGLGYVGLPLVKTFLFRGFKVIGFDIDVRKVRMLNAGRSYIRHIGTAELKAFLKSRAFAATATPTCPTSWTRPGSSPLASAAASSSSWRARPIRGRPTKRCCPSSRRAG
jgi:hypothetical protein